MTSTRSSLSHGIGLMIGMALILYATLKRNNWI